MLGAHLSFARPMSEIVVQAASMGLDTFQVFTRNPRNSNQRFVSDGEVADFNKCIDNYGIGTFVVHAPYVMNPSSPEVDKRKSAIEFIKSDMQFMRRLNGNKYYVLHPGSHKGFGWGYGKECLLEVLHTVGTDMTTTICLEFMSGAGTEMLCTLEDIEKMHEATKDLNVAFTFDSCHAYASGYDPVAAYSYHKDLYKVVHLNGSKHPKGSLRDEHTNLANGCISTKENLRVVYQVPADVPIILETPSSGMLNDIQTVKEYLEVISSIPR